jgi:hypothetical protein
MGKIDLKFWQIIFCADDHEYIIVYQDDEKKMSDFIEPIGYRGTNFKVTCKIETL